jgi:uncharacterized protein with FMN-binding domain
VTPVKHNLVALGSAAVLAVYAAGYSRTRAAAAQYEMQSENRRPRPASPSPSPARTAAAAPAAAIAAATHVGTDTGRDIRPAHVAAATRPTKHSSSATRASVEATKHEDSTPTKSPSDTATSRITAPPATPTPDSTKAVAARATDSATKTAANAGAAYKDGTYSAWGTSRHGDIEATVLIKGGRIEAAIVSQCLTQYSCSLISELPIQVVLRQSPEVDFVSGATQSTNAFYYAVVNALKKAK